MKTAPAKPTLTFGGIIAHLSDAGGERDDMVVLRLAFKIDRVVIRGSDRCVMSRDIGKK
jgi:hypothetical protein